MSLKNFKIDYTNTIGSIVKIDIPLTPNKTLIIEKSSGSDSVRFGVNHTSELTVYSEMI